MLKDLFGPELENDALLMEDCKDSEQTIYFTLGACSLNEFAIKLA